MRKLIFWCANLLALVFLATGCGGKKGAQAPDVSAFDKAPPELKQMWDTALASDKTNNFVASEMLLYRLLKQDITPEQKDAVARAIGAVKDHLGAALEKGDPAAKEALAELPRNPPTRQ